MDAVTPTSSVVRKLNGTHQLWFMLMMLTYSAEANLVQENRQAVAGSCKEIGLEVNSDKSNDVVMSRDQNAGRNHKLKTDNSSFERLEGFKNLRTTLTNQNSMREEIKIRLKSGRCLLSFGEESFGFHLLS
jgi:hypothetical protein